MHCLRCMAAGTAVGVAVALISTYLVLMYGGDTLLSI